jgi:aspartate racemase
MTKTGKKVIGVLGGCGPYAGLQLVKNIFDETLAGTDQEHIPVYLSSISPDITDRTQFLVKKDVDNPAYAIAGLIRQLEKAGADVVSIACNTSHAAAIYDVIEKELQQMSSRVKLLHIVDETVRYLKENYPYVDTVGILCSNGTYKTRLYESRLRDEGFTVVRPPETFQHNYIHQCVYDEIFGIKAQSAPVTSQAQECISKALSYFAKHQAGAVILGCTEFSLAIDKPFLKGMHIVDSVKVLARALIRDTYPEKLRKLPEAAIMVPAEDRFYQ